MAYSYEYICKITQFDVTNYTLKLTDNEGVYPDCFIPIILSESDCYEENLNNIANDMITRCTPAPVETIVTSITDEIVNEYVENKIIETV
jgi:hypothetical protein